MKCLSYSNIYLPVEAEDEKEENDITSHNKRIIQVIYNDCYCIIILLLLFQM